MPHHSHPLRLALLSLPLLALLPAWSALALETDRQQPLLINADASEGTLGDGKATLRGNVEIRQGTLLVIADQAEVEKSEGKVHEVLLNGNPVLLQQEIELQGLVKATAKTISYHVATGIVTLTGNADVNHPQYKISGELLVYDMNQQHFQGSGGDNNGRIRIQLEPEVITPAESRKNSKTEPRPADAAPAADPKNNDEISDSGSNAAH